MLIRGGNTNRVQLELEVGKEKDEQRTDSSTEITIAAKSRI